MLRPDYRPPEADVTNCRSRWRTAVTLGGLAYLALFVITFAVIAAYLPDRPQSRPFALAVALAEFPGSACWSGIPTNTCWPRPTA